MRIRPETPADADAIRAVNVAAFGSPVEASLIDALRGLADPYLSLVADDGDEVVVGHILFTPVHVPNVTALVVGLAPMAVLPARQRTGIGSALVRAGLDGCRALNAAAAIVLGHPEFYPRFGFVPADRFGLATEYKTCRPAFSWRSNCSPAHWPPPPASSNTIPRSTRFDWAATGRRESRSLGGAKPGHEHRPGDVPTHVAVVLLAARRRAVS